MARKEPGYCHHKPTGQAYVRLAGKTIYLGLYDSDESKEKYNRIKSEWLLNRPAFEAKQAAPGAGPTIAQICLAYLDYAEEYYKGSTELENLNLAIRPLSALYARLPATAFGPLEFKACRDWWNDGKRTRQYIAKQSKRLTRIVKWAVGEGLIPPSVHQAIQCVAPLKRGRTSAPEAQPIKPVKLEVVRETCKHLAPVVRDMVELQLLLGCRPGELVRLTPGMVDRSEDVWTLKLADHKTAYRGKERIIYAGPRAQAILTKYLLRGADQPCFSPKEADKQRRSDRTAARVTPASCGNRPGSNVKAKPKRQPGDAYTTMSYGRAIKYGCDRAFPAPKEIRADKAALLQWRSAHSWAPNQLRHSRATEIRAVYGLESAASILGHSEIGVTQVYAEADRERALKVAREVG